MEILQNERHKNLQTVRLMEDFSYHMEILEESKHKNRSIKSSKEVSGEEKNWEKWTRKSSDRAVWFRIQAVPERGERRKVVVKYFLNLLKDRNLKIQHSLSTPIIKNTTTLTFKHISILEKGQKETELESCSVVERSSSVSRAPCQFPVWQLWGKIPPCRPGRGT